MGIRVKGGAAVKENPNGPGRVDTRATCQALDSLVRPRGRRRIGGDAAPDVDSTKRKSRRASILGGKFWISPGRDVLWSCDLPANGRWRSATPWSMCRFTFRKRLDNRSSSLFFPFQVMTQYVRASPRVFHILLDISCVLPTSKKICQIKKELISNSLA